MSLTAVRQALLCKYRFNFLLIIDYANLALRGFETLVGLYLVDLTLLFNLRIILFIFYQTSAARLLNYILTCFYLADISMSCQRLSAAGKMERPSAYVLLFANLALRGFGTVVGLYLALLALLCNL